MVIRFLAIWGGGGFVAAALIGGFIEMRIDDYFVLLIAVTKELIR